MRQRTTIAVAVIVAVAVALGACSDDATTQDGAQPAPGVTQFAEEGAFDDLPRHPRSRAVSERTEEDGVTVQSFTVRNSTPEQVLEWYAVTLEEDGWVVVEEPQFLGATDVRGTWVKDGMQLRVSSGPQPALSDDDPVVQYSLLLRPAG